MHNLQGAEQFAVCSFTANYRPNLKTRLLLLVQFLQIRSKFKLLFSQRSAAKYLKCDVGNIT